VLLVVIGPSWLTFTDGAGRRRIDDPTDWIRQEIIQAFSHGLRVIPVTCDVEMPTENALPLAEPSRSGSQSSPPITGSCSWPATPARHELTSAGTALAAQSIRQLRAECS
jgi:hypothetical protein